MSSSPQAILYFGFPLPDTNEVTNSELPFCMQRAVDADGYPTGDHPDLEDLYDHAFGVGYQDWPPNWQEHRDSPELTSFHARHRQVEQDRGISIAYAGTHMYDNCDRSYVYVKGYRYLAEWTEMLEIPGILVLPSTEQLQKLKNFCKVIQLPYQDPKWYLTSYYG